MIDPFGICGESDRCNVLDIVGPEGGNWFDYCRNLAPAMVPEKEGQQEPFWHASTIAATEFLLGGIISGSNEFRSLGTLSELLNAKTFQELTELLSKHPNDALRKQALQMQSFQGKTMASLLACLITEHAWLNGDAFSKVIRDSTFSLRSLFEKKVTLYIVIPGHRATESRSFLRLILSAILYAAFEAGPDRNRRPLWLFLDEIATLGRGLPQLMTLYSMGRKYNLRSVSFFQSVGQISEVVGNNPDKVATFRSNMAAEVFKPYDLASAKELAGWIGNTTVQTVSMSEQTGTNSGWSYTEAASPSSGRSSGSSYSSTVSVSETSVPLLRAEEVLQLDARQAVLVSAGTPPVMIDILQHGDIAPSSDRSAVSRYYRSYVRRLWFYASSGFFLAPVVACIALGCFALGVQQLDKQEEASRRQEGMQREPAARTPVRQGIHRRTPNRTRRRLRQAETLHRSPTIAGTQTAMPVTI